MAFHLKPGGLVNNWNPWCNFNVLQCFFLLENDRDKLAKAVYRTMTSVDHFINYTHGDGGCEEGPSYWGHAAGRCTIICRCFLTGQAVKFPYSISLSLRIWVNILPGPMWGTAG